MRGFGPGKAGKLMNAPPPARMRTFFASANPYNGGMIRKKRKKRGGGSFGGSFRTLAAIALAGFSLVGYLRQEQAIRDGPEAQRVFAAFCRSAVPPTEFARMRESPIPTVSKPPAAAWHTITEVLDGDTIRVDNAHTVRLLGVDAPESAENRKLYADLGKMNLADAKPRLLSLGKTAAAAARNMALGKRCWLETGRSGRDQYNRFLAVVHLEEGIIFNEWLLSEGYARADPDSSFPYRKRYIALQLNAQYQKRGFWRPDSASAIE